MASVLPGILLDDNNQIDEAGAWQVATRTCDLEASVHAINSCIRHCPQILRQTLAGLAHIHAQGIIHRDLKPDNIFFDARGDIKCAISQVRSKMRLTEIATMRCIQNAKESMRLQVHECTLTVEHPYRLGDFGLAKYNAGSGVAATPQEERATVIGAQQAVQEDIPEAVSSGILGTLFYISPEIEKVCVL